MQETRPRWFADRTRLSALFAGTLIMTAVIAMTSADHGLPPGVLFLIGLSALLVVLGLDAPHDSR